MSKPRALITGGAGFLGSHLGDRFLAEGYSVSCMDNLITGDLRNIEHLVESRDFSFFHQDVTEFIHVPGELDVVLHFASPASPIDYLELPIQTLKVGSLGTHKALGLAHAKRARFVLASTSECYGDPLVHPQPEEYWGNVNPVGPRGVYDEAKRFAEAMTMAYHRYHGVDTRIVRIFNTYGPRMRLNDGRALPAFMSQALRGEPITVFGDGSQTRSFCYVDDLVEGIWRLLGSSEHLPTNVGNPAEMTILQFAEKVKELTGSRSEILFKDLPVDDPKVRQPDIAKARELLGWEPQVLLEDGLKRTLDYFRDRIDVAPGDLPKGAHEMCGIVGAFLKQGSASADIVSGLSVLEYRGYDSSGLGVASLNGRDEVLIRRKRGRLDELRKLLADGALDSQQVGVGHTRWATHGEPSDENAHPHTDAGGHIALVHNGIIENYMELRAELEVQGVGFRSETDTEVLAHLIGRALDTGAEPLEAVRASLLRVRGYYAIAMVTVRDGQPHLICARQGPPLVVAVTEEAAWLASDVLALLPHTHEVRFLEDGDIADLAPGSVRVLRLEGGEVERPVKLIDWDAEAADRGGYPHYMLKEIHEQPDVLAATISERLDMQRGDVRLGRAFDDEHLAEIERVQVIACGTALHAGFITKYLIEGLAGVPTDWDYASEFRYRTPRLVPRTLALAISQSGETADTLAALRLAKQLGARSATICNVRGSSMVREAQAEILTKAGPEIGVASTKAFLAQLVAAYLLAVRLGRARGFLSRVQGRDLLEELRTLRPRLESLLTKESCGQIRALASEHYQVKGFLFLGRGINYPVALEGALKLKEISYMHAEGYAAGEMKHGPIALIEPSMSTVVVNSLGAVAEKVRSNIEQVRARGGQVLAFGSDAASLEIADGGMLLPESSEWLSPILNVIPLQLLSYYIAEMRGCDIDKPRNLAKSVTVE